MGTIYTQKTDNFQLIHNVTFADGDEVVFTHGNVDIHVHGRDNNADLGSAMSDVLSHSARQFGMVLLMPNLKGKDALMTPQMALNYHKRAVHASGGKLKILSTVYLNKGLTEDDFKRISEEEDIAGAKFYPDGGTTNSEQGLRTPLDAMEQLRLAQKYQVPILLHGQTRIDQDGHVMDDGTTARLGETHFVMTTTTAAAGLVMRHLEFVRQVVRPDLDVQVGSVTEQWAQFAVAVPLAPTPNRFD